MLKIYILPDDSVDKSSEQREIISIHLMSENGKWATGKWLNRDIYFPEIERLKLI